MDESRHVFPHGGSFVPYSGFFIGSKVNRETHDITFEVLPSRYKFYADGYLQTIYIPETQNHDERPKTR
jgi:hypothetical protein